MNVVSAQVDHFKLKSGIHLQEVREIAGVRLYFYDLRVIEPEKVNNCRYDNLSPRTSHTIEHLLAHNLRQVCEDTEGRDAGEIVSVFPYGCLTGFGVISTIPPTSCYYVITASDGRQGISYINPTNTYGNI